MAGADWDVILWKLPRQVFDNPDFIVPYDKENPPRFKIYDKEMTSEDIDRSYGNSPYFFSTIPYEQ